MVVFSLNWVIYCLDKCDEQPMIPTFSIPFGASDSSSVFTYPAGLSWPIKSIPTPASTLHSWDDWYWVVWSSWEPIVSPIVFIYFFSDSKKVTRQSGDFFMHNVNQSGSFTTAWTMQPHPEHVNHWDDTKWRLAAEEGEFILIFLMLTSWWCLCCWHLDQVYSLHSNSH